MDIETFVEALVYSAKEIASSEIQMDEVCVYLNIKADYIPLQKFPERPELL